MRLFSEVWQRFQSLVFRSREEREMNEELRFHIEEETAKNLAGGMSPREARRQAHLRFGGLERTKEHARDARGVRLVETLVQDARYAVRTLISRPGFTSVALTTLALGIGANTAMFSVVHATLFRAPPVQEPDELVAVFTTSRRGFPRSSTSYPDFADYRDRSTRLADLAGTASVTVSLGREDEGAESVGILTVTGNYFALLGVAPFHGRVLGPQDDVFGGGARVAVLAHDFWEDRFEGDPDVVGRTLRLNRVAFEVVGVAPAGFAGMRLGVEPQLWIPMQVRPALGVGPLGTDFERRGNRWMGMSIGRLQPGATLEQARTELLAISDQLGREDPLARGPRSVTVDGLSGYQLPSGSEDDLRGFVWLLLGVTGFTLLLACANLANLLLVSASARHREFGVRLAIGAGRARIVRQLLTESAVLAVLGGGLGLIVAGVLLRLLGGFQLPGGVSVASLAVHGLDARLLLSALGISVATIVLFGLVPAVHATRPELVQALKGDVVRDGTTRSERVRHGLIALQLAACVVLLVGSGVFLRTLRAGLTADLGVDTRGVALARFSLGPLQYEERDALAFVDRLLVRTRELPGVDGASISTRVPLQQGGATGFFAEVDGYQLAPDEELRVDVVVGTEGYFESIGLALVRGRGFRRGDGEAGRNAIVVSESMADKYWPGGGAIGGTVRFGEESGAEVVGVAANATWNSLADDVTNYVYMPLTQFPEWAVSRSLTLALRTSGVADDLLPVMLDEIHALEPELATQSLVTMQGHVNRVLMPQRMGAALLTGFGLLALVLAAVGIAGVVSFTVNRKRRDIGVRIALGAGGERVVRLLLRSMAPPVVLGLAVGVVAARTLARTVESFMFRVDPTDPGTYASIALGLAVVAAAAVLLPARRATRIDPNEVLKAE